MSTKFRSKHVSVEKDGAYITVYQRPGKEPRLDINFFEGDRAIPEAIRRQRTLTQAIKLAKAWRAQDAPQKASLPSGNQTERTLPCSDLERYIDAHLDVFRQRPLMWGEPFSIECSCFMLLELYLRFVKPDGDWRDIAPAGDVFQAFARKRLPMRPGPMTLGQWFTDKQWGAKETLTFENDGDLNHWAGQQIAEFFIAWKKDLKAT
jgi:hypothetical protein